MRAAGVALRRQPAARAASRQSAFRSRLRQLELDRLREIEDVGHDAVEARNLFVDVAHGLFHVVGPQVVAPQASEGSP